MSETRGGLLQALRRLERAIGADEAWRLCRALAGVEAALRRHYLSANEPDGIPGPIDRTRLGLARLSEALGQHHQELLRKVVSLREATGHTKTLNRALCRTAAELATELRRVEAAEAGLVLESVNTDLGAGD